MMNFSRTGKAYLILVCVLLAFQPLLSFAQYKTGAERTELYFPHLVHKSIAVVANSASIVGKMNIVDTLAASGFDIKTVFCPEHGFRNFEEAGQTIKNSVDSATGARIVSLYAKSKKPQKKELEKIDIVLFDLQDVGVRFFTYISTLTYIMESCAETNTPLIILDRPNPNGFYVDGPVLDSTCVSFVGLHPVPIVYGLTIGEYAKMVNEEGWLNGGAVCDLQVIPLENYTRSMPVSLVSRPSPNLPTSNSILLYPSLCLFEGTVISVGRGTGTPFEIFGHPELKGFSFSFIPQPVKGMSMSPPYKGQTCLGLDLREFYLTRPKLKGRLNLSWLIMAFKDLGSKPSFFNDYFDKLSGTPELKKQIMADMSEQEIRKTWEPGLAAYREIRKKYLMYPD